MNLIITRDGDTVYQKPVASKLEAIKEYRRLRRNIRRRRTMYNYVEFPLKHKLSWYQGESHYFLEIVKDK